MAITGNSQQANQYYNDILSAFDTINNDVITNGKGDISLSNQASGIQYRQEENAVQRSPWIMSTTEWLRGSPPRGILWNANPSNITWNMPQRSTHIKNAYGTVLHVWPNNRRGTFFDEFFC